MLVDNDIKISETLSAIVEQIKKDTIRFEKRQDRYMTELMNLIMNVMEHDIHLPSNEELEDSEDMK